MKGGKREGSDRPLGKPNKTTEQVREYFLQLLSDNLDNINEDIKQLEPKDRLKVLLELSKFVVPTLKAIEQTSTDPDFNTIVVRYVYGVKPLCKI